jgi:hypothetical protein
MNDLELTVTPAGELLFCRCDPETNDALLEILSDLLDDELTLDSIREFFAGSENIERILGDEPLCG